MTEEEKSKQFWRYLESLKGGSMLDDTDHLFREQAVRERLSDRIKFLKDRCVSLELLVAGLFVLSLLLGIALIWKLR